MSHLSREQGETRNPPFRLLLDAVVMEVLATNINYQWQTSLAIDNLTMKVPFGLQLADVRE